jgi:predicted O-methyltransferase YrrM
MDAERLVELEKKFAPAVEQGRGVFSPKDKNPHAPWNLGGDKMAPDRNNYAHVYAALLKDLKPQMVVELGVFRGVSLAMWCDLFLEAMVVGLDLDFERFKEHRQTLVARGAFTYNQPILHEWDAYGDDTDFLADLPGIDLFIDDGPHTADAIRNTVRLIGPLMNPGSVYVVEDFPGGGDILQEFFPQAQIIYAGRISAARL